MARGDTITDSREQVETDMLDFIQRLHVGSWANIHPFEMYLDRQAAITRAECDAESRDIDSDYVKRVCKKIEMLKKDRDEWKDKALNFACQNEFENDCYFINECNPDNGVYCAAVLKAVDGE